MFGKHHSSGGQGGLVYTRDEALYQTIRRASDRGKPFFLPPGTTNQFASLNFNLTDLAAAIGRVQLRKLPEMVRRRQTVVARLGEGLESLDSVSLPELVDGAEASYWFLRMRFHPEAVRVNKVTFCQALSAEGLPVSPDYRAALPHTMDWFLERRVFGRSGYPWAAPDYDGDPHRTFPCPHAEAAMATHFNVAVHEAWGDQEVADAVAIFSKVEAAYHI
jgi:dTDP-4-amino-4,6-dideoxygalactose transaminase